jgi:Cysteine-rich secretory protein family
MPRNIGTLAAAALLICGALGADAAGATNGSASCPGANLSPSTANAATVDAATLCLVDQVRIAHHLRPLRANHELHVVAALQVNCLVRWNYFADDCPSWQTPGALIAATPYGAHAASLSIGQNLGWGTGLDTTPAEIVAAWMSSPEHRAIILTGAFNDAGVGVTPVVPSALGVGESGATYAAEFAARLLLGTPARTAWHAAASGTRLRGGTSRRGDPEDAHRL